MKRIGLVTAAMVLLAAAPASAAQQLKVWRHGIVAAKSDAGFAFMAERKGFAAKHGIRIDIKQFQGDTLMVRALIAGELDSYEGSPGGPMVAFSRGADIRVTGCYWPKLTYGVFARPGINTVADLRGKTFAISAPGSMPDLLIRTLLEQNKIQANAVKFAPMGSDIDRFHALSAGVVDLAAFSTEFVPVATPLRIKLMYHAVEVVPNYLRLCTYMTGKTIGARKEDAAHYLAAQMEATRYALANRNEELALTREITKVGAEEPRAAYIFDEVTKIGAVDATMPIPLDKLKWMQDLLLRTKDLDKTFDLTRMIDPTVRVRAAQLVAP